MIIRAFITHKQAELFADCQDRFGVNPDTKSIAVSDGMGSTWQQKIWAQLLVDTYTGSNEWTPTIESIKPLCQTWRDRVTDFIQKLKDSNAPENMIYRNERNLSEGRSAGATFVGIRFCGYEWSGSVLGDSCLIEWDGKSAVFHTSQDVEAFDSYPDYFDSATSKDGKGTPKSIKGVLGKGESLFLVSDPFSEFLLEHSKQEDIVNYVQQLWSLSSHKDFETLVCEWRKEGMHNDDTTLVIVENDNSEILTVTYTDDIIKMIEKEKSPQISDIETAEKESSFQESPSKEEGGDVVNFIVVPNDEKKQFINEFIAEYQRCLQKGFPKYMDKLKFKWTQKATEEALDLMFEKYSIIHK
ncbi:protein phosphatase 2C domain-containing protein [Parabacteroides sp. ZJ-118]|uniref:protein phosphatase 2C domain-containing protein n=1 Tax=Parabacteroides sp. ZJ-118 TaxID=2709398 RepID=UPI0013EA50E0|nr:protein phosphatase 2C domain-containing protein [Parabacteroides sp. ZJ-118]